MTTTFVEDRLQEFYDQRWRECGDMRQYGPSARHTRELVFGQMDEVEFSSLIDIGCGDGTFLREAIERYDVDVVSGTDISEKALELAANRVSADFFRMDLGADGFDGVEGVDGRFDIGVCSEVLEHIEDDRAALETIRSMCEQVIFTVPAGEFKSEDEKVGHIRRYSRAEFREKLESAGFEVVEIRNWGYPFYSPLYRVVLEITSPSSRQGNFGILRKTVAEGLYQVFRLNVFDRGDRIVARAKG